jgi:hypothetical protein
MKLLLSAAALAALVVGPAAATDIAFGGFEGAAMSTSITGGIAATGGIAGNGNKGFSSVENGQYAAHGAGASAHLGFTQLDGQSWGGWNKPATNLDAIKVDLDVATYSEGVQGSFTEVKDRGTGTAGIGGGVAVSGGGAFATGSFKGFGFEKW